MKLFPFLLARIGGLPFTEMEKLSWSAQSDWKEYLTGLENIEQQRIAVHALLNKTIHKIDDYPAKFYLKILQRDIYNQRTIKIKPFKYSGEEESAFYKAIENVKDFKKKLKQWDKQINQFDLVFEQETLRSRSLLQNKKLPESLTKGLQLASHSFLDRLNAYQESSSEPLNKKRLQTEQKLLQYLSRVATKTSPFSSFTKLAIHDFENKLPCQAQRKLRLNNSLFTLFRDALIHYPPFYNHLGIRLNPAMISDSGENSNVEEIKFLLNTRNIESIQYLESSDLIVFIVESLSDKNNSYTFAGFVDLLLENVDSDFNNLSEYLIELIDYGLIEWDWSFSGLDPKWQFKLISLIEQFSDDALLSLMAKTLKQVANDMKEFESGDLVTRAMVQTKAYERLKNLCQQLFEITAKYHRQSVVTTDHLKNIFTLKFDLSKEQIFYEDVSQDFQSRYSRSDFETIAQEIDLLTRLLSTFYYNVERTKYFDFFKKNVPEGKINLLSFYELYYKEAPDENPTIPELEIDKRKDYLSQLLKNGTWKNSGHFHLEFSDFPETELNIAKQHISKASFVQLFGTKDQAKAFVDTAIMGYGKMFGRFLHLFPDDLTTAILKRNKAINDESIWVENVDASNYNPNLHPPLLDWEIQMPGSQNKLPKQCQIPVQNLEVRLNESGSAIFLFDKVLKQKVQVFDFGFEALKNRSPLYQMLSTFNYQLTGPHVLIDLLDHHIVKKEKNGLLQLPRISIGNHLIIRRKGWGIPKSIIPVKVNTESPAMYFLKLNQWRMGLNIPEKVFITINAQEYLADKNTRSSSDDYKPQYMDFTSPLMVQLFSKLISKTGEYLKIEEILPFANETSGTKNQAYVCEYLMEWQTNT